MNYTLEDIRKAADRGDPDAVYELEVRQREELIEARDKVHGDTLRRMEALWDALNGRSEVPEDFADRFYGEIAKIKEARCKHSFDLMASIIIGIDDLMHISSEASAKQLLLRGVVL